MADKRISQLVERVTLENNDVFPIVASGATTTNKVTLQTIDDYLQTNLDFGVTSVAISVPTGLSVTGTPITSTGTFVVTFTAGYSIPTNAKQTEWDTAYSNRIVSVTAPITFASNVLGITQSGASSNGYLSSTDWNTFNNKQGALTFGNLTEATSSVLTITGGTGAIIGSGTSIEVKQASGSQDGFLDSADWTTFNNKQNALSGTGIVKSTGGTITYLTDNTSNWDAAYNDKINSAAVTGTTTKTLTLTQQDGGTITTTWTDLVNPGTVTSVGISVPSAFSVSNSPITSSGTIAISGAGTISQYIDGTGALQTFPSGLPPTGQAGGDLQGTYPNPTVHAIHGIDFQNGTPTADDTWVYGGSPAKWQHQKLHSNQVTEDGNLFYTDARARASISETITGIDYNSTTGVFSTSAGYDIPTTASQTNWDTAYNDKINSAAVSGTTTKTLTLTQQDGGTITASWTDINTDAVSSVFGRTGAVVAANGDYNTDQVTEGTSNLYFTNSRSRSSITLTTTGTSGAATYNSTTGVLNIPSYVGGVTSVNTLTGAVVLTTSNIAEGTNLYYTDTRARAAISLTTTGSSGAATYSAGVLNIPNYGSALSGYVPYTGATGNVNLGSNNLLLGSGNNGGHIDLVGTTFTAYLNVESSGAQINYNSSTITLTDKQFGGTLSLNLRPGLVTGNAFIQTFQAATGTIALTSDIPTLSSLGGVPTSRTLTINGTAYDLSANRSWTITAGVTGSGTDGYLPKWSGGGTSLTNSVVTDNGERIHIQGVGTLLGGGWRANQLNTAIYPVIGFNSTNTPNRFAGIGYEAAGSSGMYFWVNGTTLENITSNWVIYLRNDNRTFNTYSDATIGGTLYADQIRLADSKYIYLGNSQDLNLHHNGTDSYIQNSTGQLILRNYTYDGIVIDSNGAVKTANTFTSTDVLYVGTNGGGGGTWTWGSTDAYIYCPETKNFHISSGATGAANGIHIATNGNVTIGGTQASQKLRVNGTLYSTYNIVESATAGEIGYYRATNFGAAYGTDSNGAYLLSSYWVSAANSAFSIKTTTSTGAQDTRGIFEYVSMTGGWNRVLTLKGQYPVLALHSTDSGKYAGIGYDSSGGGGFVFKAGSTTADVMTGQTLAYVYNNGQWNFETGAASWKIYINETSNKSGENGIMVRSGYYPAIRFEGLNGVAATGKILINTFATGYGASSLNGSFLLQADNAMQFSTGGDNVRVTITSAGRVGIGSTTSNYSLYANGSICAGYVVIGDTSNNANSTIEGLNGNGNTSYGNLHIQYYAGGYLSLNNGGGNCYIGSLATADDYNYKLSVAGTIHATGDVIAYSDISVKKNIRPIENVLERVTNSRGVVYDRVDNDDKNNIGFIAQELELQFPELVNTNSNGTKGVKYQNAVAILFEAVKEQQKQIEKLKKQVA